MNLQSVGGTAQDKLRIWGLPSRIRTETKKAKQRSNIAYPQQLQQIHRKMQVPLRVDGRIHRRLDEHGSVIGGGHGEGACS